MNVIKLADTVMLVPPFVNVTAMKVESPPTTEDVTPEPAVYIVGNTAIVNMVISCISGSHPS